MASLLAPENKSSARRGLKLRGPRIEYLAFRLGGDTYAVPIGEVREISEAPPGDRSATRLQAMSSVW